MSLSAMPASQHESSLRRSVSDLAGHMLRVLGRDWAETVGLDPNRAKPWCAQGCPTSNSRQIPHPRELAVLCYLAGVAPEIAAIVLTGRWHGGPIPTDLPSIEERLDLVSHAVNRKVKGYREAELQQVLDEYTLKLGSAARARKVLKHRLGIPDVADALNGVVALPDYADAILARMLGRDLSDHWGLNMVLVDAEYLCSLDAAFHALGEREDDLVEAAVGAMGVMQIGREGEEGGDFVFAEFHGVTLQELVKPAYLGQSFVLSGSEGRKVLFHIRECRIEGVDASEVGVDNPIYYRAVVTVANPITLDPQARPVSISRSVDDDTIEGLLPRLAEIDLLADGSSTSALGVKIPVPAAETLAFAVGVPVCKGRKSLNLALA